MNHDNGWKHNTKNGGLFNIYDIKEEKTNKFMNEYIREKANSSKEYKISKGVLNHLINSSISETDENYAKKYIATISPNVFFLRMTTNESILKQIEKETTTLNLKRNSKYLKRQKT